MFGGTGFLGRRAARRLAARGFRVRAASRHPGRAQPLFRGGETSVTEIEADIRDERQIVAALVGADGAVNAVGLYIEHGNDTFRSVHVEAAARLARLCRERGLRRLIHVSGVGADPHDSSSYIRARGEGELAVAQEFPAVTIVRPTVMFGLDDAFLTTLVRLGRILPVFPLFGRGDTRLQPASSRMSPRQSRAWPPRWDRRARSTSLVDHVPTPIGIFLWRSFATSASDAFSCRFRIQSGSSWQPSLSTCLEQV